MENEILQWLRHVYESEPVVVQEIIMYGRVWTPICAAGSFILLIIGVVLFRRVHNQKCKGDPPVGRSDGQTVALIVMIMWIIASFYTFVMQVHDVVLSWMAPRLYVIQYLNEVIKKLKDQN